MDDVDATETALLLRPTHTLTRDEKLQRRRLQYKLHQRRHRSRQKQLTDGLEGEVRALADQIARLERTRHALLTRHAVVSPPRRLVGSAPPLVASEYMRQFEFGLRHDHEQEQFLRSVMIDNVGGPDYQGIDELLYQWRLYGRFFHRTQYTVDGVDVFSTREGMTVVAVRVVLTIHARREGVVSLCPRLHHDETAIQALVGSAIRVPGALRFVFDEDGAINWLGADMDFVAGLQRVLGSLSKVPMCMEDANMSFCTGQITMACQSNTASQRQHTEMDIREYLV